MRTIHRLAGFLLVPLALVANAAPTTPEQVESRLAQVAAADTPLLRNEVLGEAPALVEFYTRRGFAPAWNDAAQRNALLTAIRAAAREGLDPRHYHLDALLDLEPLLARDPGGEAAADLELIATDALARLAGHYAHGKVDPRQWDREWNHGQLRTTASDAARLDALVGSDLANGLDGLLPAHPMYRLLRDEYARHLLAAARGGWATVPAGPALRPGTQDARVPALRRRLGATGDLAAQETTDSDTYDAALQAGVERFQRRQGLKADGVVGDGTLAQLNIPVAERLRTLRVNLDRGRVLLHDLPSRFVVVNVAAFEARLVDGGNVIWEGRAQVGKPYRATPLFRSEITYVQWNPTWTVPPTIIKQDILPDAKRNPASITRRGLVVLDRNGRQVPPSSVPWHRYASGNIPYTLRQGPGPNNALGRVKIMFPNEYHVYLHDTPARNLFDADDRAFSSGCVRVEDPVTLTRLLIDDPAWDAARVDRVLAAGKTQNVVLKKRVPVLLAYWTAWVDKDGLVQFRRDPYRRDDAWHAALVTP